MALQGLNMDSPGESPGDLKISWEFLMKNVYLILDKFQKYESDILKINISFLDKFKAIEWNM